MKISIISPMYILNQSIAEMAKTMMMDIRDSMSLESEFIIVDNQSTHGVEYMQTFQDIYVRLPKNTGWGGGLNYGMRIQQGDYLMLANNDIRIGRGWEEELVQRFEQKPNVGTISINNNTGFQGCFFQITRDVYTKTGEFDIKNYPLGHAQDCDYLYRLIKNGWDIDVMVRNDFAHGNRMTYNQKEFRDKYENHPNFSQSDFQLKWGFSEGEWLARGIQDRLKP